MHSCYFVLLALSTVSVEWIHANSVDTYHGYVTKDNDKFAVYTYSSDSDIEPNVTGPVVARGYWDQSYNVTGWSVLEIWTNETETNEDQSYAAGLLEGRLTEDLIRYQRMNSINDICDKTPDFCPKLDRFLRIQLDWMYDQIKANPNSNYWHQIKLLLIQLNGLIDGYKNIDPPGVRENIVDPVGELFLFQIVESTGELAERLKVDMTHFERRDSCSALIKILPGNADIFVSHADWSHYKTMLKVIKRYIMPLKSVTNDALIPGNEIIFSSYPGTLHSIDDFYMMYPSKMVVIETTIENGNPDLVNNIFPISVPEWMRAVVANRLANNGSDWMNKFVLFNDATYNNQWMVSDYKKFTSGKPPEDGFLTIGEQMTAYFKSDDFTDTLRKNSFWASYNNVYFPDFRNYSKENDRAKTLPELYSWMNSSRAQIFGRDHGKVVDEDSMMKLMRYNNFKTDPLSRCSCPGGNSAELSIAARCDLNLPDKYPDPALGRRLHGATDAKMTGSQLLSSRLLRAIAGPTTENQNPFDWTNASEIETCSHIGHPTVWNFAKFTPTWTL